MTKNNPPLTSAAPVSASAQSVAAASVAGPKTTANFSKTSVTTRPNPFTSEAQSKILFKIIDVNFGDQSSLDIYGRDFVFTVSTNSAYICTKIKSISNVKPVELDTDFEVSKSSGDKIRIDCNLALYNFREKTYTRLMRDTTLELSIPTADEARSPVFETFLNPYLELPNWVNPPKIRYKIYLADPSKKLAGTTHSIKLLEPEVKVKKSSPSEQTTLHSSSAASASQEKSQNIFQTAQETLGPVQTKTIKKVPFTISLKKLELDDDEVNDVIPKLSYGTTISSFRPIEGTKSNGKVMFVFPESYTWSAEAPQVNGEATMRLDFFENEDKIIGGTTFSIFGREQKTVETEVIEQPTKETEEGVSQISKGKVTFTVNEEKKAPTEKKVQGPKAAVSAGDTSKELASIYLISLLLNSSVENISLFVDLINHDKITYTLHKNIDGIFYLNQYAYKAISNYKDLTLLYNAINSVTYQTVGQGALQLFDFQPGRTEFTTDLNSEGESVGTLSGFVFIGKQDIPSIRSAPEAISSGIISSVRSNKEQKPIYVLKSEQPFSFDGVTMELHPTGAGSSAGGSNEEFVYEQSGVFSEDKKSVSFFEKIKYYSRDSTSSFYMKFLGFNKTNSSGTASTVYTNLGRFQISFSPFDDRNKKEKAIISINTTQAYPLVKNDGNNTQPIQIILHDLNAVTLQPKESTLTRPAIQSPFAPTASSASSAGNSGAPKGTTNSTSPTAQDIAQRSEQTEKVSIGLTIDELLIPQDDSDLKKVYCAVSIKQDNVLLFVGWTDYFEMKPVLASAEKHKITFSDKEFKMFNIDQKYSTIVVHVYRCKENCEQRKLAGFFEIQPDVGSDTKPVQLKLEKDGLELSFTKRLSKFSAARKLGYKPIFIRLEKLNFSSTPQNIKAEISLGKDKNNTYIHTDLYNKFNRSTIYPSILIQSDYDPPFLLVLVLTVSSGDVKNLYYSNYKISKEGTQEVRSSGITAKFEVTGKNQGSEATTNPFEVSVNLLQSSYANIADAEKGLLKDFENGEGILPIRFDYLKDLYFAHSYKSAGTPYVPIVLLESENNICLTEKPVESNNDDKFWLGDIFMTKVKKGEKLGIKILNLTKGEKDKVLAEEIGSMDEYDITNKLGETIDLKIKQNTGRAGVSYAWSRLKGTFVNVDYMTLRFRVGPTFCDRISTPFSFFIDSRNPIFYDLKDECVLTIYSLEFGGNFLRQDLPETFKVVIMDDIKKTYFELIVMEKDIYEKDGKMLVDITDDLLYLSSCRQVDSTEKHMSTYVWVDYLYKDEDEDFKTITCNPLHRDYPGTVGIYLIESTVELIKNRETEYTAVRLVWKKNSV